MLMDGLDEVQTLEGRITVVNQVEKFFNYHRQRATSSCSPAGSWATGRPARSPKAWPNAPWWISGEKEIEAFVKNWTRAIEKAATDSEILSAREAKRQEEELMFAVRNNPGVERLAANPLLLTILALMKRQGVALPERRVELYHKYTEVLIKQWNLARSLDKPCATRLDLVETVGVLAPLALWMHETSPGVGLVGKGDILGRLTEIYRGTGRRTPGQGLRNSARRRAPAHRPPAGARAGHVRVHHLTFQEYLAAVGLAQKGQLDIDRMVDAVAGHIGDPTWVEVTRLAVAHLGINQYLDKRASEILEKLSGTRPGKSGGGSHPGRKHRA